MKGIMEIYQAIENRKTIRDFSDQPISDEIIRKLIAAGFQAPSNNHMRDWQFILFQDRTKRKELFDEILKPVGHKGAIGIVNRWGLKEVSQREMYIDAIPKQYSMLFNSACLILPFFKQETPLLNPRDLSALNPFASIWCCIENILLAASAEGIYGVTRIPFDKESACIKEKLGIPGEYEFPCYIALGYPAANAQRAKQVEINPEERIHINVW
jgi:nitroreductase